MPDPAPPPAIPRKLRPTIANRLHRTAESWRDPTYTSGKSAELVSEQEREAFRLDEFADRIAASSEDLEHERKPEMAALVNACLGLGDDAFSAAMAE